MIDFISREEAYTIAKRICDAIDTTPRVLLGRTILDFIDDIPAADVRPVVKAKWEWNDNSCCCYCGNCDAVSPREDQYGEYIDCPNFCPNCGADMRGK